MAHRTSILEFDELNELDSIEQIVKGAKKNNVVRAIPYREYFGAMYITPEKMKSRMDFAEQIEDAMLWIFAYWLIAADAGISKEELKQDAKEKLTSVIAKRTKLDSYLEKHINDVIDEVVDTTEKHTKEQKEGDDTAYWTSQERAMLISENEVNAFDNYIEYREAKAQGKTQKTWITELDDKVRLTHELAEGQTVDIDGLFFVGGSKMRFPKDTMYDASPQETVNCRCVCEYK